MEPKVLICDDKVEIRRALAKSLEQVGVRAILVRSGREALSRLRKNGIEVAVLDGALNRMNGIETVKKIERAAPNARVIFLTPFGTPDYRSRIAAAGVKIERWVDKGPNWLAETTAAVVEVLERPRMLNKLKGLLLEVRANYRDVARRQLAWSNFRRAASRLWEVHESLKDDRHRQQLADQLDTAIRQIEAHQLKTQHLSVITRSLNLLCRGRVSEDDVDSCDKAWRLSRVDTLPSFGRILEEWRELCRVEE